MIQREQRRFYDYDVMSNYVGQKVKFRFMFQSHEAVLHLWTDGGRCGEFLEKIQNGQLSEGLVVHVNETPDGKKVCGVRYLPAATKEPQDSKDWTTEFYHNSRQVALKLKLLCC